MGVDLPSSPPNYQHFGAANWHALHTITRFDNTPVHAPVAARLDPRLRC